MAAENIDYVEGNITQLYDDPTSTGKARYTMEIKGIKIQGWAKDIPKEIKEAMTENYRVRVGYTTKEYNGKDYYTMAKSQEGKNDFLVVSEKKKPQPGLYPQQEEKITAKPNAAAKAGGEYVSADKFEGLGALTAEAGKLLDAAREAFKNVYDHYPMTEGELAVTNTAFIFLSKHWAAERWLRGNQGISIEEYLHRQRVDAGPVEGKT